MRRRRRKLHRGKFDIDRATVIGNGSRGASRARARAAAEDLHPALPHIEVPTLLVNGDDDVRAPMAVADHLHQAIRGSTLVRSPGVGHVCNIEAPDAFNATIRYFLDYW